MQDFFCLTSIRVRNLASLNRLWSLMQLCSAQVMPQIRPCWDTMVGPTQMGAKQEFLARHLMD